MKKQAGFTLLEMLVVLSIISLLMSLIGPSFINNLKQSERRFAVEQIQSQLEQLPRWAHLFGQPFSIEKLSSSLQVNNEELLQLPDGWSIEFSPALTVSPIQICAASSARIFNEESVQIALLTIAAPHCEATEQTEASP